MFIKYILILLLIIHGLVHLLGGFSELKIAEFNNMSGVTLFNLSPALKKFFGIFWLLVTVLFFLAATGLTIHEPWWREAAVAAVITSQVLIIFWWHDAKFGTLMNILIIIGLYLIR